MQERRSGTYEAGGGGPSHAAGAEPLAGPLTRAGLLPGLVREVIWELDATTDTLSWGETLTTVLGWTVSAARRRSWWQACVHPKDREAVVASFRAALEGGARIWSASYRFRREDGVHLPVHDRAFIVRDETGAPTQVVGCLVDLTEAREMEARIRREHELRERFIGILGHDLRTPLNAIHLSAASLQRRTALDPLQEDLVRRIAASTSRMERMIRDMLDLTRARWGGGIPIQPEPCDPHALGFRVVAELRTVHPEHVIVFETQGEGHISGDPERLEQALANLLGNACRHSPPGRPITVRSELGADRLCLSVHNWGPPIDGARQEEIFEPFHRGELSSHPLAGLGLGLYIVREVIQAHDGFIQVGSSEQQGTCFRLELPRLPASDRCGAGEGAGGVS